MFDSPAASIGQEGPPPLGWPEFEVVAVHHDYIECKAFDGAAAYGDTLNIAKAWDMRRASYDGLTINGIAYSSTAVQRRTGGVVGSDQEPLPRYNVAGDGAASIITAQPLLTIVRNDADSDDVACQWREVSGRIWFAVPGQPYTVIQTASNGGVFVVDYVRAHA